MSTTAPGICLSWIACWIIESTVEKRADAGLASMDQAGRADPATRTAAIQTKTVAFTKRFTSLATNLRTIEQAKSTAGRDRLFFAISDERLSCFLKTWILRLYTTQRVFLNHALPRRCHFCHCPVSLPLVTPFAITQASSNSYGRLTLTRPFPHAVLGLTPAYDDQNDRFAAAFRVLEEAIAALAFPA